MARPWGTLPTNGKVVEHVEHSKSTLHRLVLRCDAPDQMIGRHWRFHKAAIDKWLGQEREQKG